MSSIMRQSVDNVNRQPADVADAVFDAIHTLMHLYRARQYRVLRGGPHEITHLESKVLGFFERHPGASAGELVAHSGRDKAQIARLVAGLRERGLLEAEVDAADRRRTLLRLSDAGRQVQQSLHEGIREVARQGLDALDGGERRQLLALLERVKATLEADDQASSRQAPPRFPACG